MILLSAEGSAGRQFPILRGLEAASSPIVSTRGPSCIPNICLRLGQNGAFS